MSVSLKVTAYTGKKSKEFQKHLNAVKFCIENDLSYPKETSEFFKGKLHGNNLEDISKEYAVGYIENGVEVPIPVNQTLGGGRIVIELSKIPSEVESLIIDMC